jgi:hypothetical protein
MPSLNEILRFLAEFINHNNKSENISITSFYANSGCHSYLNFNLSKYQDAVEILNIHEHTTRLHKIYSAIESEMAFPQAKQQKNANRPHNPVTSNQNGNSLW